MRNRGEIKKYKKHKNYDSWDDEDDYKKKPKKKSRFKTNSKDFYDEDYLY